MKTYEYEELEEKFKKLPRDVQLALTSVEVADDIQKISDKNGLLLDQTGVLFDLFSYVLLGLLPANEFVRTFAQEARVDEKTATAVAKEINDQVFSKVRSSIQAAQTSRETASQPVQPPAATIVPKETPAQQNISTLEKAGGFSLEQNDEETENTQNTSGVSERDKYNILTDIENPLPAKEVATKKGSDESYAEPLVDRLLNTSSSQPEQKISQGAAPKFPPPGPPAEPPKKKGPDPYLEPVN